MNGLLAILRPANGPPIHHPSSIHPSSIHPPIHLSNFPGHPPIHQSIYPLIHQSAYPARGSTVGNLQQSSQKSTAVCSVE